MTQIDWTEVQTLAEDFVQDSLNPEVSEDALAKYDGYIMEAVINAIYGKEIWDELNTIEH